MGERVIVREPPMDPNRRRSIEPREESQFLKMVGKTIGHRNSRSLCAAQGISNLKIVLTPGNLSGVPPCWSWIVSQGIIHPFRNFVGQNVSVVSSQEEARSIEIRWRVSLDIRGADCSVIPEGAAVVDVGWN